MTPQAQNFARHGYAVLKELLDPSEIAEIQQHVQVLPGCRSEFACSRPHNQLLPLRWSDRIVQLFLASNLRIRRMRKLLVADDLRWISGYVSIKEAHSLALWWHQDWWCWDHPVSYQWVAPQVAIICYLTETDQHNGALRVLPGSHHSSTPLHAVLPEAHGRHAETLEVTHLAMSDTPDQKTLRLHAGDAAVIDYRLLHGTHSNTTSVSRVAILLTFTPSWKQLPDDIKSHLIQHPAQPSPDEQIDSSPLARLLPDFQGERRTLQINRNAPLVFDTR